MKRTYLLFALLLPGSVFGQQSNTVTILESSSKKPVAWAHVASAAAHTITNETGQCILPANLSETDSITISCIGYKTRKIAYKNIKPIIRLTPDIRVLKEVVVFPFNAADTISKAKKRIPFNHYQEGDHIAFFRDVHFKNDTLIEMAEANIIYQVNKRSKKKIALLEMRRFEDSLNRGRIKSTLYDIIPERLDKSFILDTTHYRYTWNGTLRDSRVYEIRFEAKNPDIVKSSDRIESGNPYIGKIYLKVGSLSVAKIALAFSKEALKNTFLRYKLKTGGKGELRPNHVSGTMNFTEKDGKMVLLNIVYLIVEERIHTGSEKINKHVHYKQLFVKDLKKPSKFKKKDVLYKNAHIYALSNKDYNVKKDRLPAVLMPTLKNAEDIKRFLKTLKGTMGPQNQRK